MATPQKGTRPETTAVSSRSDEPCPQAELVGSRLTVYCPKIKRYFPGRVIEYDARTKVHTFVYYKLFDARVEEIGNLGRTGGCRDYLLLLPTIEELVPGSPIGKKIFVEMNIIGRAAKVESFLGDNPGLDARKKVYTAIVLQSVTQGVGEGDVENGHHSTSGGLYEVIFLHDKYIDVVDLRSKDYTILDMHTNEPIKEVQASVTHEAVGVRPDLGRDIELYSPEEDFYYTCRVIGFDEASGKHKVHYNDGAVKTIKLDDEKWRFAARHLIRKRN